MLYDEPVSLERETGTAASSGTMRFATSFAFSSRRHRTAGVSSFVHVQVCNRVHVDINELRARTHAALLPEWNEGDRDLSPIRMD